MSRMNEYEKRAKAFLRNTNTVFRIRHLRTDFEYFGDSKRHDVYRFSFTRNGKDYSATFGDSIANTQANQVRLMTNRERIKPTAYDVLSCLTKYEPERDVFDFADEYGYTFGNAAEFRKVEKTHRAVQEEYEGVCRLWGDCLDELREIE